MKLLSLVILFFSINTIAQLNDTLVYKTGYKKLVEIESYNVEFINFKYFNKTLGETKSSKEPSKKIRYFVTYDEDGVLTYDSRMDYSQEEAKIRVDSLKIPEHDLMFNPFMLPFLSPSLRYTYKFGNYMEWGVHSRFTYVSPIIGGWVSSSGILMAGVGIKFSPYYSRKFSFGLDFVPEILLDFEGNSTILLPFCIDLDFYFGQKFGFAADFGVGYVANNPGTQIGARGNMGILLRLGQTYNIPNQAPNAGL